MSVGDGERKIHTIGIDLGTTFSAVAILDQNGQAQALPNAEGSLTTPSVALWHEGTFVVGQSALDLVQSAPLEQREPLTASLVRGVKRMIGQPPDGGLLTGGFRTTPVAVSAAILAKLARDASTQLGFPVSQAVITVPAHFGDGERSATKAAAEMAGLQVLQMMNEPSAAALAYSHGKAVQPGVALVFDLGGGTFDATVLQHDEQGNARVLATQGIEELGGINFTNKLAGELQRRYESQTQQRYPSDHLASDLLVVEAEKAKCQLSEQNEITVELAPIGAPAASIILTRRQFERQINLHLIQLQTAVEIALERARLTPEKVERVLLCGGSSRIPAVQAMLEDLFGKPPERILDLDLSVALGAAYQAANCERVQQGQEAGLQLLSGGLIVDCVSYAVGIAILNARGDQQVKLIMLHAGDPLDTWSPPYAVRLASASSNFPPIAVYRGEETQLDAADYLGETIVTLPPGLNAGTRAMIQMLQDQSGLIHIQIVMNEQIVPGALQRVQH
ncbi:Hsp70 family protein [Dictyobacter arantiisoli]|uniref:Chaperone protein DnaK n=1 Tax=Dictyobacter arantiisoli TaxID=2014874 RepID=A0A5A5T9M1_9CHLR|nr:Hsp70 family protein [Dictyobacter arantiisoli]GCF07723.1 chaperone protein DnaK [Dictyobacter arantiisoli]